MGEALEKNKLDKNLILCCGIFAVYAVLTFIGAANHELWFDEAQAWNIARDNDIAGIFHQLGYEGHPPLWYLILYIPSHLGLSCEILPYISWFITGLAGALVMFRAPFNIFVRSALLFSGGFIFTNSVMSRVYCLINLVMVLIAILYPKRKRYPILFGLLIALLANTHIIMSGFIGILGIFMITDFFKGCRTAGAKQNIKELCGLAIAGIGVLFLVIPLINSVSLNYKTNEISADISSGDVIVRILTSFFNISRSVLDYGGTYGTGEVVFVIKDIVSFMLTAAFITAIIEMRHKTRPFLILLFSWFFYTLTSEVLWVTIPNRALVFVLIFFVTAWIAEYEPQNNAKTILAEAELKTDTRSIRKILEFIRSADKNYQKTGILLITGMLILSVPAAAVYLFRDYTEPFCPSKQTAEYIRENLPEDSVFITDGEYSPPIAAYLPEHRFYSLDYGRFYTYCTHDAQENEVGYSKIYDDLKDCEHLYFMFAVSDQEYYAANFDSSRDVLVVQGGMPYGVNICFVRISKFDLETDLPSYVESV